MIFSGPGAVAETATELSTPQHPTAGRDRSTHLHADGRIDYAKDNINPSMDRAYRYDLVGRLSEGLSGSEARGQSGTDGIYRQSYSYDVWDNLTGRPINRFWSGGEPFTSTYVNNRQQGIQHDNDGRVTYDQSQRSHIYDAAGRKIRTQETSKSSSWGLVLTPQQASSPNSLEREQERPNMPEGGYYTTTTLTLQAAYDAEGRSTKRVQTKIQSTPFYQPVTSILTEYYVRSSVLGGKVITELNDAGEKHKTKVYAGGDVIAEQKLYSQNQQGIIWQHKNPITSTEIEQNASNGITTKREYDPWGLELGETDPYLLSAEPDYASLPGGSLYRMGGNPFGRGDACQWNGMPFNCGMLGFVMRTQRVDRIDVYTQGHEGGGFGMQFGLTRRWVDGKDGVKGREIDMDGEGEWGPEVLTPYRKGSFVWEFGGSGILHSLLGMFMISSLPQKSFDPVCLVPPPPPGADVNANIREAEKKLKEFKERAVLLGGNGFAVAFAAKSHYVWFQSKVDTGGPWDYKNSPLVAEEDRQYFEKYGNFHYGAAGAAAGFSTGELLRAAGYIQERKGDSPGDGGRSGGLLGVFTGFRAKPPYGDQERDQKDILKGINYYKAGCHKRP